MVPPGRSRPSFSAASIMARPMRSLIDPAGFWFSSFTNNRHGPVVREAGERSEEHTSELQSLMRISYAVFCLQKKNTNQTNSKTDELNVINKHTTAYDYKSRHIN